MNSSAAAKSLFSQQDRARAENLARIFKEVDWLIPPFVSIGSIEMFAREIERTSAADRLEAVRKWLSRLYNEDRLARMYLERYTKIPHVLKFGKHIDEALRCHFSGHAIAAVSTLVPVIEGIVREMALRQSRDLGSGTRRLKLEFDALVDREENSPHCYGERLVMLEALRDFIRDRFLERTKGYSGLNELNRHGIVHGIFANYGDPLNFYRLVTLLDLLCFSIGLIEGGVSGFAPDASPESVRLRADYIALKRQQESSSGSIYFDT